ncbi:MAG: RsmB/NOP family class I SAM-dependent RNA methyltransferase [Alphaproteobacteria bacterium]
MSRLAADARAAALDLLRAVLDRRHLLDEAFDAHSLLPALEARDRAFARAITTTALRRLGQIDALIDHGLEHPLPARAQPVRHILRLGVCQLLFLGTPAHAAVDTTVALAEEAGWGPYKKLVNAVLRRLDREGPRLRDGQDAARLNTPGWLWESWCRTYGAGRTRAIAAAHLAEPPLDISVKEDPVTWAARLDAAVLPTGSLRRGKTGAVAALPGYKDGAWWVQDAAAALPVRLLGPVAGKDVLDLCAAPGGKTAQLAAAGARVTAVDRSRTRLARLADNLTRLRLEARTVAADATRWRPAEPASLVLLDAPCTTTGAIRRHPDVAWIKTAEDVPRLAKLQDRLLKAASGMLEPGGVLVYTVCSLQAEEGSGRIHALLERDRKLVRVPVRPEEIDDEADFITDDGDLHTLPCHWPEAGGLDGFYAARLQRST